MKIKILFIGLSGLLIISSKLNAQAQVYHPFPEKNAFWTVWEFNWNTYQYEHYIYTILGDTLIDNLTYKKIYKLSYLSKAPDTLWTLHEFMRQDVENKKVYFIRHYMGETTEKLGYDFNVTLGDTVYLPAFDYGNIGDSIFQIIPSGTDSIQLYNGEYRKTYFYGSLFPPYGNLDLYVIEGVGEQRTAFPNLFFYDPFHQSELTCLLVNDVYLYGFSPYPVECGFVGISENQFFNYDITIFPNPVGKLLNIKMSKPLQGQSDLLIFNTLGVLIYKKEIKTSEMGCTLDISTFPNGIYSLIIENKDYQLINVKKFIVSH